MSHPKAPLSHDSQLLSKNHESKASKPTAHISITLSTSSPTISLSSPHPIPPFEIITTARIVSSSRPSSTITFQSDRSVLDNGNHTQHDGIFRGAFIIRSLTEPSCHVTLAPPVHVNYGSQKEYKNLLEIPSIRFETVPALGQGELVIRHPLSLKRMFHEEYRRYGGVKKEDVVPGDKFTIALSARRLGFIWWWAFGDLEGELKGKKFSRLRVPDEQGEWDDMMPGEEEPDLEKMRMEGWVFSERSDALVVSDRTEGGRIVVEFVE